MVTSSVFKIDHSSSIESHDPSTKPNDLKWLLIPNFQVQSSLETYVHADSPDAPRNPLLFSPMRFLLI